MIQSGGEPDLAEESLGAEGGGAGFQPFAQSGRAHDSAGGQRAEHGYRGAHQLHQRSDTHARGHPGRGDGGVQPNPDPHEHLGAHGDRGRRRPPGRLQPDGARGGRRVQFPRPHCAAHAHRDGGEFRPVALGARAHHRAGRERADEVTLTRTNSTDAVVRAAGGTESSDGVVEEVTKRMKAFLETDDLLFLMQLSVPAFQPTLDRVGRQLPA